MLKYQERANFFHSLLTLAHLLKVSATTFLTKNGGANPLQSFVLAAGHAMQTGALDTLNSVALFYLIKITLKKSVLAL